MMQELNYCALSQKQSYPVLKLFCRTILLSLAQVSDALHDQNYQLQKYQEHPDAMLSRAEKVHILFFFIGSQCLACF